jgi:hypothetical protein
MTKSNDARSGWMIVVVGRLRSRSERRRGDEVKIYNFTRPTAGTRK